MKKNIRDSYRALFNTDLGVEVLNDMAKECGLYDNIDTDEDKVLFNYFRSVLQKIGIFDKAHTKNGDLVRKLMELPLVPEGSDDWKQGHVLPKEMRNNG